MNIEGPLTQHNLETDPTKKHLRRVAEGLLKNELNPENTKEHLGHVIVRKEAKNKKDTDLEKLKQLNIETMNRAELLSLSETITIDGSSLRQIFETKLIGENGLRRLIREFALGGDLKSILRHEILE